MRDGVAVSFADQPMIFVTGASRSGTTMLTNMLGKHSRVAGLREMHFFGEFCDPRRDPATRPLDARATVAELFSRQKEGVLAAGRRRSRDPGVSGVLDSLPKQAGAAEIFAAAIAAFSAREGKAIPCEQTPRNIYYAAALLEWYPRARFVHVLRDPRGVMASQKFRWRRRWLIADPSRLSRRQQLRTWINYHPYIIAQLWNLATRRALELEDHPRVRLLKLEDLILEPEQRMREVCDFLEIDFEPAMLDVEHLNSSHVSSSGASRGLDRSAIDAWRGKLSADEQALVHLRCGTLMGRLGYESEPVRMTRLGALRMRGSYLAHLAGAALVNPRRSWIQARGLLAGGRRVPRRGREHAHAQEDRTAGNGCGVGQGRSGDLSGVLRSAQERVGVLGLSCLDVDLDSAARDLVDCAAEARTRWVAFVNAHTLNVSVRDSRLARALREADTVFADGVGMAMAARLQGRRLRHNVNGTDLFPHLCRHAARAGIPIALFGAAPEVAGSCVDALTRDHPGLRVAWSHHGYVEPSEHPQLIDELNGSGAGILLVAMGVPRQELWILENRAALKVPVVMGVGGLFDFVSGRVPRAPAALRRLRLEWLFRLMIEPRRLFGRYVIGNPLFLARACRYALTGRVSSAARREATLR